MIYEQFFSEISICHEENETIYLLVPEKIKDFLKNKYFACCVLNCNILGYFCSFL